MDRKERIAERLLILRAQLGDLAAFTALVRAYHGRLLYFVRRLLGSPTEADDVVQEVWLVTYRQIGQLAHPDAFRAWLYRIARNKAVNLLRKRKSFQPLPDDLPTPDDVDNDEAFLPTDPAAIHLALNALSPHHREVLVLRFLEQMPYEEMAETLGCHIGTIKSRLHHAKRALRRQMEDLDNVP